MFQGVQNISFTLPSAMEKASVGHQFANPTHPWNSTSKISCYLTISEDRSITPWHMDFGSTTVWYTVIKGVKEFFIVKATPKNRSIFEEYSSRRDIRELWLPSHTELEGGCQMVVIRPGMSVILPAGTIHAVRTVGASMAFGANILLEHDMLSMLPLNCIHAALLNGMCF